MRKPWSAASAIGNVLAPIASALAAKPRHVCSERCDCARKAAINRRGKRRWIDTDPGWLRGGRQRRDE